METIYAICTPRTRPYTDAVQRPPILTHADHAPDRPKHARRRHPPPQTRLSMVLSRGRHRVRTRPPVQTASALHHGSDTITHTTQTYRLTITPNAAMNFQCPRRHISEVCALPTRTTFADARRPPRHRYVVVNLTPAMNLHSNARLCLAAAAPSQTHALVENEVLCALAQCQAACCTNTSRLGRAWTRHAAFCPRTSWMTERPSAARSIPRDYANFCETFGFIDMRSAQLFCFL
jgi:hypothetical protein